MAVATTAAAAAALAAAAAATTTKSTATSFMASHKNLELDSQLHKKLSVFICERNIFFFFFLPLMMVL